MAYKIGLDARFFAEAGPGRYIKNIVEHLELIDTVNEYIVFVTERGMNEYSPKNPNFKKVLSNSRWYTWNEQVFFLWQIIMSKLDIFYVPHFNFPVLYPKLLVTAIPDIIMHTFSTEKGTTLPKPYFLFKKLVYKQVVWWALVRSKKVIVPTYDVYNDITTYYPQIDKNKFVVAYEGVDPAFTSQNFNIEELLNSLGLINKGYLLYVSSMYEHKNVHKLLDAFEILVNKYVYDGKLVLIGKKDKYSGEVYARVQNNPILKAKVVMPGMQSYVTDDKIVALRKAAALYVFPSLKEGFSLTPLEAQAVGLPSVVSNISCHKEVFEDSVVYFDPHNSQDIAEKISMVLKDQDLQQRLIQKGYNNVKKYNWLDTAKITLQVFHELLNAQKR